MPTYLRRAYMFLPIVLMVCVVGNGRLAAQSIFESCAKDLETYCGAVTPGDGRTLACIYAHEDKVSDKCDAATENGAALLDCFSKRSDMCTTDAQTTSRSIALELSLAGDA